MTKKEKETINEVLKEMGGEWIAPIACAHLLKIGEEVAKTITVETITQEVNKTRQREQQAEKEGKVYLMSAEFVGEVLKAVFVLMKTDTNTRKNIIKKYL